MSELDVSEEAEEVREDELLSQYCSRRLLCCGVGDFTLLSWVWPLFRCTLGGGGDGELLVGHCRGLGTCW